MIIPQDPKAVGKLFGNAAMLMLHSNLAEIAVLIIMFPDLIQQCRKTSFLTWRLDNPETPVLDRILDRPEALLRIF